MNKLTGKHVALIIFGGLIAEGIITNTLKLIAYKEQLKAVKEVAVEVEVEVKEEEAE